MTSLCRFDLKYMLSVKYLFVRWCFYKLLAEGNTQLSGRRCQMLESGAVLNTVDALDIYLSGPKPSFLFSALCCRGQDSANAFPLCRLTPVSSDKRAHWDPGEGKGEGEETSWFLSVHRFWHCCFGSGTMSCPGSSCQLPSSPPTTSLITPPQRHRATVAGITPSSGVCVPAPWGEALLQASSFR